MREPRFAVDREAASRGRYQVAMRADAADRLWAILKRVSRSFYLSLQVLPRSLRRPMGLAYLFARAADTIADTALISREERLRHLEAFRGEFRGEVPSRIAALREALVGPQRIPEERELLLSLDQCFDIYQGIEAGDREKIRDLILTLTQGMQMDLRTFPGENEGRLVALQTRADLDRYTYYVAGCVGEFWTDMHMAHRPSLAGWDRDEMRRRGVRFGKGLQMTNILRDLAGDFRIGRCYLPLEDLRRLGIAPEELMDPRAVEAIRPLLTDLLALTLEHYREGWAYTLAIPRREARMRLACAWPLLIGLKTLGRVARAEDLLDPRVVVKIRRPEVYRIMLRSAALVWSNRDLDWYYRRLRRRVPVGL